MAVKRSKRNSREMAEMVAKVNAMKLEKRQQTELPPIVYTHFSSSNITNSPKRRKIAGPPSAKPEIRQLNENGYWLTPSGKLEHRVIYRKHHGSIPSGYVVHHIDQCKTNNEIHNLLAIPACVHDRLHAHMRRTGEVFNRAQTLAFCSPELNARDKYREELKETLLEIKRLQARASTLEKLIKAR